VEDGQGGAGRAAVVAKVNDGFDVGVLCCHLVNAATRGSFNGTVSIFLTFTLSIQTYTLFRTSHSWETAENEKPRRMTSKELTWSTSYHREHRASFPDGFLTLTSL
jgi:hypothetical protein